MNKGILALGLICCFFSVVKCEVFTFPVKSVFVMSRELDLNATNETKSEEDATDDGKERVLIETETESEVKSPAVEEEPEEATDTDDDPGYWNYTTFYSDLKGELSFNTEDNKFSLKVFVPKLDRLKKEQYEYLEKFLEISARATERTKDRKKFDMFSWDFNQVSISLYDEQECGISMDVDDEAESGVSDIEKLEFYFEMPKNVEQQLTPLYQNWDKTCRTKYNLPDPEEIPEPPAEEIESNETKQEDKEDI